jgi:hypothetical protein
VRTHTRTRDSWQVFRGRAGLAGVGLAIITSPLASTPVAVAADTYAGYGWGYSDDMDGDGSSLIFGSTETAEDYVFLMRCSNTEKSVEMTVYVDIAGAKVGRPVTIKLSRDGAQATVKGKTASDDKSGYVFAVAKDFPIKPVIGVLNGKGPIKVVTRKTETLLPEEGRAPELAEFVQRCQLE